MRKLGLSLAFIMGAVAPIAAQQMWQPEIGLRASYVRFADPTNSSNHLDVIDFPATAGLSASVMPASLYGIIPLSGRFALSPSFGLQSLDGSGTALATVAAGVRLNAALTRDFYVAAGAAAYLAKNDGDEDTQGAIEGAVGYRRPMGAHIHGSAEAFYEKRETSRLLQKLNVYGLRIGMGYNWGPEARATRAGRPMMRSDAMWERAIGIQGGLSLISIPQQVDLMVLNLPFGGQSLIGGAQALPGPSPLSVLLPMGQRFAIEPSVDFHRAKANGTDPITAFQLGARVNYAFNHTWYAGAGLEGTRRSQNGADTKFRVGEVLAAGARFPVVGGLKGRTELNFRMTGSGGADDTASGQMTSFVFGLLVPMK